jgi:hypothetical protein
MFRRQAECGHAVLACRAGMTKPAAALFSALLLAAAARADSQAFTGNWENAGRDQSGIAQVVIAPAGGDRLSVRIYGDCHPFDCDWGAVEAKAMAEGSAQSVTLRYDTSFARRQIVLSPAEAGELAFQMRVHFHDGSRRPDITLTGRLKHSAWAGPVGQSWNRLPSTATGWGGGARSGAAAPPKEVCTAFDPASVEVAHQEAGWQLKAGSQLLMSYDEKQVRRAEQTIRFYRFDRRCRIGGIVYWRRGDSFPDRKMDGADCIFFNPTTVHEAFIGKSWQVVDGVQWLFGLDQQKPDADAAIALIRFYKLNAECTSTSRSDPMVYWLSL